jgi:hypothetical protein
VETTKTDIYRCKIYAPGQEKGRRVQQHLAAQDYQARKERIMTHTSQIPGLAFYTLGAAFYAIQIYLIWRKERNKSKDL